MNQVPLKQYLKGKRQGVVASLIGVTQGGLSQMLKSDRRIFVAVDDSGEVIETFEIKPVGKPLARSIEQTAGQPT